MDREQLGKIVRMAWIQCKRLEEMHGRPVKDEHLWPWDKLPEREKETDRYIGEAVAMHVLEEQEDAKAKLTQLVGGMSILAEKVKLACSTNNLDEVRLIAKDMANLAAQFAVPSNQKPDPRPSDTSVRTSP